MSTPGKEPGLILRDSLAFVQSATLAGRKPEDLEHQAELGLAAAYARRGARRGPDDEHERTHLVAMAIIRESGLKTCSARGCVLHALRYG